MAIIKERGLQSKSSIYKVGILTCSTSRTHKDHDITAQALVKWLENSTSPVVGVSKQNPHHKSIQHPCQFKVVQYAIVPDNLKKISNTLRGWCDFKKIDLILTAGGTGFSLRDVTPEATRSILDREAPNLAEVMRLFSEPPKKNSLVPYLSRGVCGLRKRTLILNLPGSPKGAQDSLQAVSPLLPHILELSRD